MVRAGLPEKMMFEQRQEVGEGETMQVPGRRASQSGSSKCKGLKMGECLAWWRNREEAGVGGAEIKGREGEWQRWIRE